MRQCRGMTLVYEKSFPTLIHTLCASVQLALLPQQEQDNSTKLMDHNDLYVLDLAPSLKTLCMLQVTKNNLNTEVGDTTVMYR